LFRFPAFLVGLVACGWGAAASEVAVSRPREVTTAELKTWLTEGDGHLRVVNFWASWCGPCVAELPTLRQFSITHREVEVVLVNVDEISQRATKVLPLIAAGGPDRLNHLLLKSATPAADLQATVPGWQNEIPFTMVQAPDGRILESRATPLSPADLEAIVTHAAP